MDKEIIDFLKGIAERTKQDDNFEDFDPCSFSGGNYDDAYYIGQDDGEVSLAREILERLNIRYEN
jgi:hypothetical protein